MTLPPLALYVHVPWCVRRCPYCDFNAHEAQDRPWAAYFAALRRELESHAGVLQARPAVSVFFGGGTPSLTPPVHVAALLDAARALGGLAADAEITLEANPGTLDLEHLPGYRAAGVDRLSLGIQSFDDGCLERLGRIHDGRSARAAVERARRAGFDNLNVDLMHGLPGQSVEAALADLATAVAEAVPHISWYQLTIEPNTPFHKAPPLLPDEPVLEAIERQGGDRLAQAGYDQYEVSAWARPGRQCRHNRNYWQFGDYLGLGAGAHSKLTTAPGRVRRWHNLRMPQAYLGAAVPATGHRELDAPALREEFLLNALRLQTPVEAALFEARTGLSMTTLQPAIAQLTARGLVAPGPDIVLTPLGRRFLDDVVAAFL